MVCPICTGVGVNAIVSGSAAIATTIGGIVASKKVKSPPPSKNKKMTKSKRDSK